MKSNSNKNRSDLPDLSQERVVGALPRRGPTARAALSSVNAPSAMR